LRSAAFVRVSRQGLWREGASEGGRDQVSEGVRDQGREAWRTGLTVERRGGGGGGARVAVWTVNRWKSITCCRDAEAEGSA
jgi:hypothetical protein